MSHGGYFALSRLTYDCVVYAGPYRCPYSLSVDPRPEGQLPPKHFCVQIHRLVAGSSPVFV